MTGKRMRLWAAAFLCVASGTALGSSVVYLNDFEGVVGDEWSHPSTDTTPAGNRRFLGEFNPETVVLTLADLPQHIEITVSFDLLILRSWDGNGGNPPDIWDLSIPNGPTLIRTTFSNHNLGSVHGYSPQAFPNEYPGDDNPSYTGAAEMHSMGYTHPTSDEPMDSVYALSSTFSHSANFISLRFSASLNSAVQNESWGLYNFTFAVTPPFLGDVNNDGIADNLDITPFLRALEVGGDEARFLTLVPGGSFLAADTSKDGFVNNLDITPFIDLLTDPATDAAAIPEPASVMLLLPLMAMRRGRRRC